MNERIQELAYDAEEYADTMVDGGSEFHPVFVRKFAELIVFECIKLAVFKGDSATGKAIKEHFGVEE